MQDCDTSSIIILKYNYLSFFLNNRNINGFEIDKDKIKNYKEFTIPPKEAELNWVNTYLTSLC